MPNSLVFLRKLSEIAAAEAAKHPEKPIEVFATDEHRLGLKPVTRRVWAPIGERPIAHGHHRFEWLYVTAFVSPATGEVFWYVHDGVSKPFFEALLALFAKETGAGDERIIILALDSAGWHTQAGLEVPEGLRLVFLPPYSPELQPAETLWTLVDEPIVNKHIPTLEDLEDIISKRCLDLAQERETIKGKTGFHWWPKIISPN
jgi:transposase